MTQVGGLCTPCDASPRHAQGSDVGTVLPELTRLAIFDEFATLAAQSLGEDVVNYSLVRLEPGKSTVGDVDEMASALVKAFSNLISIMGMTEQWLEVE
ncbi:hypothetical protein Hypma_001743 [Hypsizygus marmoreus]|uniref:Uncharacterized protein n=1 Tax=Hypsizygus marmoreus TaxID=39966 RepID=A0A369JBX9_HYPMA|nr:hypothetical protein Hypma_001743 [Hypsizygus marmoreus]